MNQQNKEIDFRNFIITAHSDFNNKHKINVDTITNQLQVAYQNQEKWKEYFNNDFMVIVGNNLFFPLNFQKPISRKRMYDQSWNVSFKSFTFVDGELQHILGVWLRDKSSKILQQCDEFFRSQGEQRTIFTMVSEILQNQQITTIPRPFQYILRIGQLTNKIVNDNIDINVLMEIVNNQISDGDVIKIAEQDKCKEKYFNDNVLQFFFNYLEADFADFSVIYQENVQNITVGDILQIALIFQVYELVHLIINFVRQSVENDYVLTNFTSVEQIINIFQLMLVYWQKKTNDDNFSQIYSMENIYHINKVAVDVQFFIKHILYQNIDKFFDENGNLKVELLNFLICNDKMSEIFDDFVDYFQEKLNMQNSDEILKLAQIKICAQQIHTEQKMQQKYQDDKKNATQQWLENIGETIASDDNIKLFQNFIEFTENQIKDDEQKFFNTQFFYFLLCDFTENNFFQELLDKMQIEQQNFIDCDNFLKLIGIGMFQMLVILRSDLDDDEIFLEIVQYLLNNDDKKKSEQVCEQLGELVFLYVDDDEKIDESINNDIKNIIDDVNDFQRMFVHYYLNKNTVDEKFKNFINEIDENEPGKNIFVDGQKVTVFSAKDNEKQRKISELYKYCSKQYELFNEKQQQIVQIVYGCINKKIEANNEKNKLNNFQNKLWDEQIKQRIQKIVFEFMNDVKIFDQNVSQNLLDLNNQFQEDMLLFQFQFDWKFDDNLCKNVLPGHQKQLSDLFSYYDNQDDQIDEQQQASFSNILDGVFANFYSAVNLRPLQQQKIMQKFLSKYLKDRDFKLLDENEDKFFLNNFGRKTSKVNDKAIIIVKQFIKLNSDKIVELIAGDGYNVGELFKKIKQEFQKQFINQLDWSKKQLFIDDSKIFYRELFNIIQNSDDQTEQIRDKIKKFISDNFHNFFEQQFQQFKANFEDEYKIQRQHQRVNDQNDIFDQIKTIFDERKQIVNDDTKFEQKTKNLQNEQQAIQLLDDIEQIDRDILKIQKQMCLQLMNFQDQIANIQCINIDPNQTYFFKMIQQKKCSEKAIKNFFSEYEIKQNDEKNKNNAIEINYKNIKVIDDWISLSVVQNLIDKIQAKIT